MGASVFPGLFRQAVVTLNNTQIKALPSQAITVVAAPASGFANVPIACSAVLNTVAGAYAADTGSSWLLQWHGGFYIGSPLIIEVCLELAQISFKQMPCAPLYEEAVAAFSTVTPGSSAGTTTANASGLAIEIKDDWNSVTNYTLGHADNTLLITTLYVTVNLTTGAYV